MGENSASGFSLTVAAHPAFGRLIVLASPGGGAVRLTAPEALTLSRALAAVRAGRSAEREIYLSPIASDADVIGAVGSDGVRLGLGDIETALDWDAVEALAAALAKMAEMAES
ncbi:MAG TPA: hypothetical protein PKZ97_07735 [Azospirillaceae bacterium]|nr:hypothetical protein [Azospirillaceae bacterium]HRQ80995.1 hypothetical protein [Azospirillaceae bacterium]